MKPLLLLLWLGSAACAGRAVQTAAGRDPSGASLVRQHKAFIELVRSETVDAAYLPTIRALRYELIVHSDSGVTRYVELISPADLLHSLREGTLRDALFIDPHAARVGSFAMQVLYADTVPWRLVAPNTFAPPECITGSRVRVEWRREEGRWVIAALTDEGFDIGREPAWIESAGCLYQQ